MPAKSTADLDAEFAGDWEILRNDIDPAEFEKLKRVRELLRCKDDHPACENIPRCANPYVLLRQLRSCALDPERTANFVGEQHLEWIAKIELDKNLKAWRKEYAQGKTRRARIARDYCAITEGCPDKNGVPIFIIRFGVLDTTGLVRDMGRHAILMHWMDHMERASEHLTQACRRLRRFVPGQIWLCDGGNCPYVPYFASRMTFGAYGIGDVVKAMKYPVIMRKVIIIRLGFVLHNLWRAAIYPLLTTICSKAALSNIHVGGNSASGWRKMLGQEVDEHGPETPAFLFSDSAEACATISPRGGLIPNDAKTVNDCRVEEEDESTECSDGVAADEPPLSPPARGPSPGGSITKAPAGGRGVSFDVGDGDEVSLASSIPASRVVSAAGMSRDLDMDAATLGGAFKGVLAVAEVEKLGQVDITVVPANRNRTGCICDVGCDWY